MLQASTLHFLTDLKINNGLWLKANGYAYEAAKADFTHLADQVLNGLRDLDFNLVGTLFERKDYNCTINRSIRFSADKFAGNTSTRAWFNPGGNKTPTAGYLLHIEPGGDSFLAGGLYRPEPNKLALIRKEIHYNPAAFEQVLHEPSFKQRFGNLRQEDVLKHPPKGYQADNPAIEYLKLKSFTCSHPLADEHLTQFTLTAHVLTVYQSLMPLVNYLNRALSSSIFTH